MNGFLWAAVAFLVLAVTVPLLGKWLDSRGALDIYDYGPALFPVVLALLFGLPALACAFIGLLLRG